MDNAQAVSGSRPSPKAAGLPVRCRSSWLWRSNGTAWAWQGLKSRSPSSAALAVDDQRGLVAGTLPRVSGHTGAGMASARVALQVTAVSDSSTQLIQPCVDCGLWTGNWCECFGEYWMPNSPWEPGQRTPLCTRCDRRHGECHNCRGIPWCTPFAHGRREVDDGETQ